MCRLICNPLCLCKIPAQPESGSTLLVSPLMRTITLLFNRTTAVVCLVPTLSTSSSHLTGTFLTISPSFTSILSLNNTICASNEHTHHEFIASDPPQTGGSHQTAVCQESQRMNHQSFIDLQFCWPDICPQTPGHGRDRQTVDWQGEAQACADQCPLNTLEVLTEQAPRICESGGWIRPTDIARQEI